MTQKIAALAAVLLGLLSGGCLRMDYVGQTFPELDPDQKVTVYGLKTDVPAGEYRVIGRGEIAVPDGYGNVDLREKLEEYAREHGASAVKMVSLDQVQVSDYYQPASAEEVSMTTSPGMTGIFARSPDGSPIGVDSFDKTVTQTQEYRPVYKQVLKVLFLMTEDEYKRALASRRAAEREPDVPREPEPAASGK